MTKTRCVPTGKIGNVGAAASVLPTATGTGRTIATGVTVAVTGAMIVTGIGTIITGRIVTVRSVRIGTGIGMTGIVGTTAQGVVVEGTEARAVTGGNVVNRVTRDVATGLARNHAEEVNIRRTKNDPSEICR